MNHITGYRKTLSLIFLPVILVCSVHTQTTVRYHSLIKGTLASVGSIVLLTGSTLAYVIKKLQSKSVPRNEKLSSHYVYDKNYLHLFVQKKEETGTHKKSCIMYLHGIGGHHREMRTLFSKEQKYLLDHADYIIPCIEFTNYADSDFAPFFNTDFGQEQDILTALNALKTFFLPKAEAYKNLLLMGRSRGGAITTNLVGVLSTKDHYLLEQSDISESERVLILEKLISGGIILSVPLICLEHAVQKRCGNYLGSFLYHTLFCRITRNRYNPQSELKPLIMMQQWGKRNIPVFAIIATDDEVVGTKYNDQFLKNLENYNGAKPEIIHITGGHKSPQIYEHSVKAIHTLLFENLKN